MIKKLTDEISVSPQILPSDLAGLRAAGFKSLICNRPDGEVADQPLFSDIVSVATAAGMEARYIPIAVGEVCDADVASFAAAVAEMPKPVLAYCRSGTRSATVWAISEAGRKPASEIVDIARSAGYDVTGVMRRLAFG